MTFDIIFWGTVLVVVFFLVSLFRPDVGQRVLHRPMSRMYAFHLVLQTILLGGTALTGLFLAYSRTSCGGFEGSCHSYLGQELLGGAIILVGLIGFIATWQKWRWLVYWNWLLLGIAAYFTIMLMIDDFLLFLSLVVPLLLVLLMALTTKKAITSSPITKDTIEIVDNRMKT